jgi:hypothetical protein
MRLPIAAYTLPSDCRRIADRIFGRSAAQVFYPSTGDGRVRRAGVAHNKREREAAEQEERTPVLLTLLTLHECRLLVTYLAQTAPESLAVNA